MKLDLDHLKKLCAEATPPPWEAHRSLMIKYPRAPKGEEVRKNEELIAAARNALPALVEIVEAYRALEQSRFDMAAADVMDDDPVREGALRQRKAIVARLRELGEEV